MTEAVQRKEEQQENNVININGKNYSESDLSTEQHYLIAQVRDLQGKANVTKFQLDQVQVSLDYFTNKVLESIEVKDMSEITKSQIVN